MKYFLCFLNAICILMLITFSVNAQSSSLDSNGYKRKFHYSINSGPLLEHSFGAAVPSSTSYEKDLYLHDTRKYGYIFSASGEMNVYKNLFVGIQASYVKWASDVNVEQTLVQDRYQQSFSFIHEQINPLLAWRFYMNKKSCIRLALGAGLMKGITDQRHTKYSYEANGDVIKGEHSGSDDYLWALKYYYTTSIGFEYYIKPHLGCSFNISYMQPTKAKLSFVGYYIITYTYSLTCLNVGINF